MICYLIKTSRSIQYIETHDKRKVHLLPSPTIQFTKPAQTAHQPICNLVFAFKIHKGPPIQKLLQIFQSQHY